MNLTGRWQSVLDAPADPERKTEYVEALAVAHDARAELFGLAADYKRLRSGSYIDAAAALKPRVDALVAAWRAELSPCTDAWQAEVEFVDGWPIELTIAAADFARNAAEIVATVPIRHLNLTAIAAFSAAFDVPQFEQIVSLDGSRQEWTDDAIRTLANSPRLSALRWLDLSHGAITEAQVDILAASSVLKALAMLDLSNNLTRDPVDASAGYGVDWMTNTIVPESIALPEFGHELEDRHGTIGWLHGLDTFMEAYPPSRYSF